MPINDRTEEIVCSVSGSLISISSNTAQKTIFSFSELPEKMLFPKKSRWNLIFFVLSGKMIFLFPENIILPPNGKWKMIFLKNLHGNMIFFLNVLKKLSFQKGPHRDMILLVLSGKVVFFSPKTWYFFPGRKTREGWPFSRNTRKHDIFYLICSMPPCENKTKTILSHKNTPKGDWHSRSTP